jgi:hypothetical protein
MMVSSYVLSTTLVPVSVWLPRGHTGDERILLCMDVTWIGWCASGGLWLSVPAGSIAFVALIGPDGEEDAVDWRQ